MSDSITIDDFAKSDIRIGTVEAAAVPSWSHWVMKLAVDFGEEIGKRTIFSGIMKFFKPEDLVGKQFPFVVNLEPKKIGPKEEDGTQNFSEGMMIMVDPSKSPDDEDTAPILFQIPQTVPNGAKVR
jgi:methionyl-tRNA synthetase